MLSFKHCAIAFVDVSALCIGYSYCSYWSYPLALIVGLKYSPRFRVRIDYASSLLLSTECRFLPLNWSGDLDTGSLGSSRSSESLSGVFLDGGFCESSPL